MRILFNNKKIKQKTLAENVFLMLHSEWQKDFSSIMMIENKNGGMEGDYDCTIKFKEGHTGS